MGTMGWGMGVWMLLGGLVLAFAVLALGWGAASLIAERRAARSPSEVAAPAMQILHRRYAAGEIDDAEYRHRRAQLDQ